MSLFNTIWDLDQEQKINDLRQLIDQMNKDIIDMKIVINNMAIRIQQLEKKE